MNSLTGVSGKAYKTSQKFDTWVSLVMDKNNKVTFGNLTASAAEAYGYDLTNKTGYNNARVMGFQNYKKLQDLASIYYDKKGLTLGRWLDISFKKMITSNNPFWWIEIGEIMGYRNQQTADT